MSDPSKFDIAGKLLAEAKDGDNAQPVSVSEISNALKRTVEDRFGHVRIRGELTGYKRAASGHVYFGLKDDKAMIDGVMWKSSAARLAFAAEDGLEVIASGKLTTYPGRSKYQIVANSLELAGEGALMALFEKIRARLTEEGLFSAERKKPIPHMPRHIGIVTSPTGAVIRDILHRLNDRFPCRVTVWPTNVQGEGAKDTIAAGVHGFNAMADDGPDLIIVARGGGSIEDLWAFNEEAVVRAVADSAIPVISAVGHETDTTLCDYAADLRAPTPTAAAEMAVPVRAELQDRVGQNALRLGRAMHRSLTHKAERLEGQRRLLPRLSEITAPQQQRADDLAERLQRALERRIDTARIAFAGPASALRPGVLRRLIDNKYQRLAAARLPAATLHRQLSTAGERLAGMDRLLDSFHPLAPLKRGFARVTDSSEKTIGNVAAAQRAGHVKLRFADGETAAVIDGAGAEDAAPLPPKPLPPEAKAKPKRRKKPKTSADNQPSLFGD